MTSIIQTPVHTPTAAAYKRRTVLGSMAGVAAGMALPAWAQSSYPSKPVTLIVPNPPGGNTDILARIFSVPLSKALGQPVVVENRGGAGGVIGMTAAARAAADGHTMGLGNLSDLVVSRFAQANVPYDPAKDFEAVGTLAKVSIVVTALPSLPAKSFQELLALARANPGKVTYATSGNGSAPHLAGILFNSLAGTDMLHIPFKGGAPAVQSLIAGDTQVIFGTSPVVLPQVRGGRVRPLAITTQERSDAIPNIMGMKEAGLAEYNISFSFGLYAPMKTPPDDLKKIFDAAVKVLKRQDIREKLATQGMDPLPNNSPNEFRLQNQREAPLWSKLIEASGAKVD